MEEEFLSTINETLLDNGNETATGVAVAASTPSVPNRDERLAVIEISTLSAILLLAVTSNLTMLIAIVRQRANRPLSRMYFFMMHLSLADLLVSVFNILPQLAWDITYRFYGGDLLCRFVKYTQIMTLYLSTYILMFMAVDRYRAVTVRNNLHWNSLKVAKTFVAVSWVMALLFAIPQAVIFSEQEVSPGGATDCWVQFVEPWGAKAYVTWFVISIFGAPLLVIIVCYGIICRQIWIYSQSAVPRMTPSSPPLPSSSQHQGNQVTSLCTAIPSGTQQMSPQRPAPVACCTPNPVAFIRRWFLLTSFRWRKARSSSSSSASTHSRHNGMDGNHKGQHHLHHHSVASSNHSSEVHSGPRGTSAVPPTPTLMGATVTSISGNGGVTASPVTMSTRTAPLPQCCHHQPLMTGASLPHLRRSNSTRITKAKMKTIKLTLAVVICFVACWAPFCIAQLVMVYSPPSDQTDISSAVVIILLLASLNSCTNPWVYLAFSGSLFNQMRLCLGLGWLRGKDNNDSIGEDDRRGATAAPVLGPPPQPRQRSRRSGGHNQCQIVRMAPSLSPSIPHHRQPDPLVVSTAHHSDSKLLRPNQSKSNSLLQRRRSTLSLNIVTARTNV